MTRLTERRDSDQNPERDRERKTGNPGRALAARVYWMFFGYIPILGSTAALVDPKAVGHRADLAFWASVAAVVIVRLYDVTRLGGKTSEGDPATLAHWARHAGWLCGVALVLWGAIRIASNQR